MIPPSLQMRQAQIMQNRMAPQADPLMQALSQQQMAGDMLKELASHKLKMLKLRAKYEQNGIGPKAMPAGQNMIGPEGQTYY